MEQLSMVMLSKTGTRMLAYMQKCMNLLIDDSIMSIAKWVVLSKDTNFDLIFYIQLVWCDML